MTDSTLHPRPSIAEIQANLGAELASRSRVLLLALLLADLVAGVAVASLLFTEPDLPLRTRVAFALLTGLALAWAALLGWSLTRRHAFLAQHRLRAARLACVCCGVFTVGAFLLAATQPDLRASGGLAGVLGIGLTAVASWLLIRSRRRVAELVTRRDRLVRQLEQQGGE